MDLGGWRSGRWRLGSAVCLALLGCAPNAGLAPRPEAVPAPIVPATVPVPVVAEVRAPLSGLIRLGDESIAGARLSIVDGNGQPYDQSPVVSDASGEFTYERFEPARTLLFVLAHFERDGREYTLAAPVPAGPGPHRVQLEPGTTLVAKKAREMLRQGVVSDATLSPGTLQVILEALAPLRGSAHWPGASLLGTDLWAAIAFDALLAEHPALLRELQEELALDPGRDVLRRTPRSGSSGGSGGIGAGAGTGGAPPLAGAVR